MSGSVLEPVGRPRSNQRTRECQATTTLHRKSVIEEAAPDHVSTTASESSSEGSNNSKPPLLDFINATCIATALMASCFPCAVVDVDDRDDYVVDRLSRESAMSAMYESYNNITTSNGTADSQCVSSVHNGKQPNRLEEQNENVMYVQLSESGQAPQNDAPIHSTPSIILDEDSRDDDVVDVIPLNDDAVSVAPVCMVSAITGDREPPSPQAFKASANEVPSDSPSNSPPKKKFGMKLFRRKKKA